MDISIASHILINGPINKVFLWGMMGSGKTTFGKKLANKISWNHADLDDLISRSHGASVAEIFADKGEEWFRMEEAGILRTLEKTERMVISTGGGTPHFHNNAEWMVQAGFCVWLDGPIKMLAQRITNSTEIRPLISDLKEEELLIKLEEMLQERTESYQKAHMILNISKMDQREGVKMLSELIREKS